MSEQLWGGETTKAIDNFPVSGERIPVPVVRWLGRLKGAAAQANGKLGGLDGGIAERIAKAGAAVAAGEHDDQFPIDVFQTGSGTSSNMNTNEVLANLAKVRMAANYRCAGHEYRLLAGGHIHFSMYNKLMPWDHLAGTLIFQEAGGYAARLDGSRYLPQHREGGLLLAPDADTWERLRGQVFTV